MAPWTILPKFVILLSLGFVMLVLVTNSMKILNGEMVCVVCIKKEFPSS